MPSSGEAGGAACGGISGAAGLTARLRGIVCADGGGGASGAPPCCGAGMGGLTVAREDGPDGSGGANAGDRPGDGSGGANAGDRLGDGGGAIVGDES